MLENYEILTTEVEKKDRIRTSVLQDQFINNKLTPAKFNQLLKLNGVNLKIYSGILMATNIKQVELEPEQEQEPIIEVKYKFGSTKPKPVSDLDHGITQTE